MAKMAQRNSEQLKANLRPITSAPNPQNNAPISIPEYAATVKPRVKEGWNSAAA